MVYTVDGEVLIESPLSDQRRSDYSKELLKTSFSPVVVKMEE
jgi:hypothetical protein